MNFNSCFRLCLFRRAKCLRRNFVGVNLAETKPSGVVLIIRKTETYCIFACRARPVFEFVSLAAVSLTSSTNIYFNVGKILKFKYAISEGRFV